MSNTLDRREFTRLSVLAALSGVAITISGCGGGGGSNSSPNNPTPTPSLAPGDKAATISANHGHTAVITNVQLLLPQALVAKHVTGLEPSGKQKPEGGLQPTSPPLNTVGGG